MSTSCTTTFDSSAAPLVAVSDSVIVPAEPFTPNWAGPVVRYSSPLSGLPQPAPSVRSKVSTMVNGEEEGEADTGADGSRPRPTMSAIKALFQRKSGRGVTRTSLYCRSIWERQTSGASTYWHSHYTTRVRARSSHFKIDPGNPEAQYFWF